jgi:DNA-binding NarL/FixJ family response regulator
MTVRVLIADDQQLIRAGFRMILGAEPDIEVIGEAGTGAEAVALTRQVKPDVVLMDIRMPDLDGIEATRRILADSQEPKPCVLILTTFDLDEYVYDALRAGASGFLLKDAPEHQLVAGIRTVGHGDALLAPSITRRLIAHFASNHTSPQAPSKLADLTPRELEVLRLLATGLSNGEIAGELIVGETTIKTHVTRILMKLGVRDRVQAVVFAYETGLVSPGRHPPASPDAGRPSDIRDRGASRWQLLQGTTLGMAGPHPLRHLVPGSPGRAAEAVPVDGAALGRGPGHRPDGAQRGEPRDAAGGRGVRAGGGQPRHGGGPDRNVTKFLRAGNPENIPLAGVICE